MGFEWRSALPGVLVLAAFAGGCDGESSSSETGNDDGSGASAGGNSGDGSGAEGGAGDSSGAGGASGSDAGPGGAGGTSGTSGTSGDGGDGGDENCGDGTVGDDECDDGNRESGDGCSQACEREDGWRCDLLQPTRCVEDCGDGLAVGDEARAGGCDDGNDRSNDGCSSSCRLETGYACPVPGRPCVSSVDCGDGMLSGLEICDDGNDEPDDGCSGDCLSVDPGFLCPSPGRDCVPRCGDGIRTAGEACDDDGVAGGDGCSSTCRVEPGWSCTGTPSTCTQSICGNGVTEAGESCDDGTNAAAGRLNGLFTGAPMESARGCSKTCSREPSCRDSTGTRACATVCGDGSVETGEQCDDGNRAAGDGCSTTCTIEDGFVCTGLTGWDTEPCALPGNNCRRIPVTYRDFDGQNLPGGHPDFLFLGATPSGGTRVTCIPNASGRAVAMNGTCWDSDSTPLCTGIAAATLGPNGKPTLGATSCTCRFTDWDNTGVLTGVTGTTTCNSGAATPTRIETTARVVQSAQSFAQWYTDSAIGTKVIDVLQFGPFAGAGMFRFSSSAGRTVLDDLHDIFMGTAIPAHTAQSPVFADAPANSLSSGFFPLEARVGSHATKVCNLWPYWPAALTAANCIADDGNPVWQQWDPRGSYTARMAGTGGPVAPVNGVPRNFYFTSEVRQLFQYTGNASITFYGDDDVWVFVNGKLVLDLGATHESLFGTATLAGNSATWTIQAQPIVAGVPTLATVGSGTVADLGLEVGRTYELVVFHADRHPRESNYQLSLSGFSTTTRSDCMPECGDGVATSAEECDEGPQNADGVYGGCSSQCRLGPFCGDGTPNGPEECDDGVMNGGPYGEAGDCTTGCRAAHFCGDENVDLPYGEECDDGSAGSTDCDASCRLR
jgi:fibro-slime domain-containing protein